MRIIGKRRGTKTGHTYGVYEGRQKDASTIAYWPERTKPLPVVPQKRKGILMRWAAAKKLTPQAKGKAL